MALLANRRSQRDDDDRMARQEALFAQNRRDQGLDMLFRLAQEAPDVDVLKVAPAIASRFGNTLEDINAASELQKGAKAAQRRSEQEAQAGAAEQGAAGVLTDPMLAPELTLPQLISQLRAVETAGQLMPQQLGQSPPGTATGGDAMLNRLDIARTESQVKQREARKAQGAASAKELIAEARTLRNQEFTDEKQIRAERLAQSKTFFVRKAARDGVLTAAARLGPKLDVSDGAADLSLIMNFARVQDPGVSVKSDDVANIVESGGLPTKAHQFAVSLLKDGKLTAAQRKSIVAQTRAEFATHERAQKQLDRFYRGLARQWELNPDAVVDASIYADNVTPPPPPEYPNADFIGYDTETGNPLFSVIGLPAPIEVEP